MPPKKRTSRKSRSGGGSSGSGAANVTAAANGGGVSINCSSSDNNNMQIQQQQQQQQQTAMMKRPLLVLREDYCVPPKKRKSGMMSPAGDFNSASGGMAMMQQMQMQMQDMIGCRIKIPVPEWLKVSIQLMLLNFHPEGVALLNVVESEFEDMYRNVKVNPEIYGFEDWEEMLKSPQFKKHFFMYTEKKMMYVKGLPLSRSGTINLRNNVWEIDPKVDAIEMPLAFQEPAVAVPPAVSYKAIAAPSLPMITSTESGTAVSTSSLNNNSGDVNVCDGTKTTNNHNASKSEVNENGNNKQQHANSSNSSAVLSPAPPKTSGRKPKIYNGEYTRLDPDFLSSTRVKPSVMNKLAPETIEDKSAEDEDTNGSSEESQTPDPPEETRQSCTEVPCSTGSNNRKDSNCSADADKEDNDNGRSSGLQNNDQAAVIISNETFQKEVEKMMPAVIEENKIPVHVEMRREDNFSDIHLHDAFFRRSELPEDWTKTGFDDDDKFGNCKLSDISLDDGSENELVIDETGQNKSLEILEETKKELEVSSREMMNSPSPPPPKLHRMDIILPPQVDPGPPKSREDEESKTLEKLTRPDLCLPEISRAISVIRTLSEDTKNEIETSTGGGASTLNSPTGSEEIEVGDNKDKKWKQYTGVLDPGVSFFPWVFHPLQIHNNTPSISGGKHTRAANPDSKIDSTRDPRLTVGFRSKRVSQQEKPDGVEKLSNEVQQLDTVPSLILTELDRSLEEKEKATSFLSSPFKKKDDQVISGGIESKKTEEYNKVKDFVTVDDKLQDQFQQAVNLEPNIQRVIREPLSSHSRLFTEHSKLHYQQEDSPLKSYQISPEKLTVTIQCHPEDKPSIPVPEAPSMSYTHVDQQSPERTDSKMLQFPVEFSKRKVDLDLAHSSKDIIQFQRIKSRSPKLRNPIPYDGVDPKSITFEGLLKDAGWKTRILPEKDTSKSFFSAKVLERWKETKRKELTPPLLSKLVTELQTYENKPYPSRCEYYCRSSLRMVEVDFITNNQFSEPRNSEGCDLVQPDEILFYADFAGAPGGVAEFYSKKRPWESKGFGITYKSKFYDLNAIPEVIPQYFEAFYGKLNSNNGDGSLFSEGTVDVFLNRVMYATKGRGVHVVTTIGNLSRVFEENNDKIWKYQHLAQIFVGLKVLREDGNMVFKMHDIKTAFSAALLYFLYKCFKEVEIAKLDIFAPASDERAIICVGRRSNEDISGIMRFLGECHKVMKEWYQKNKMNDKNQDSIGELIPLQVLEERKEFMEYLRASNDKLKSRQTDDLILIARNLKSHKSIFTRAMYRRLVASTIERWNVGMRPLFVPSAIKTPSVAYRDLKVFPEDICEGVETLLNEYNLYSIFSNADPWKFIPIGKLVKTRGFYLGVDNTPHFFDQKYKEWVAVRDFRFSLPSQTLVYAQIVPIHDESDISSSECIFTIIDALYLSGKDIRNLPYRQRMIESRYFCSAVTRIFYPRWLRLTVTEAKSLSELPLFLSSIKDTCKIGNENSKKLSIPAASVFPQFVSSSRCFHPSGVLFFETLKGNTSLDFCATLFSRVCWKWVEDMDLPITLQPNLSNPEVSVVSSISGQAIGSVSARKLIEFVNRYS